MIDRIRDGESEVFNVRLSRTDQGKLLCILRYLSEGTEYGDRANRSVAIRWAIHQAWRAITIANGGKDEPV